MTNPVGFPEEAAAESELDLRYQRTPENQRRIALILGVFKKYAAGTIVPHSEISQAIDVPTKTKLYDYLVLEAREIHRDTVGTWSRVTPKLGVRLLTPSETLHEENRFRNKKARTQLRIKEKAFNSLVDHNWDSMTVNERNRAIARLDEVEEQKKIIQQRAEREDPVRDKEKRLPRRQFNPPEGYIPSNKRFAAE